MKSKFFVTDEEKLRIRKLYLIEDSSKKDGQKFCNSSNTKELSEIVGDMDPVDYVDGIKIRQKGVNGLVDKLELLKGYRLSDKINDGGVHLAYSIMNDIKGLKPYNYFDETRNQCDSAINKVSELYGENKHGTKIDSDIEEVMLNDDVDQRAKEYLKYCLEVIKGK
jgi:hypothetical protein